MLSISLVGSEEMVGLNLKYRGKPGSTNVLSFPQNPPEQPGPHEALLGDVVICADRVAADAHQLNYSDQEMTLYLLIHGVLHLVGYEHDQPGDAERMEKEVNRIFRDFTEKRPSQ